MLSRTLAAPAYLLADTIENDDMPLAEVIAVIALIRVARGLAEIIVVGTRVFRLVFMIADRWAGVLFLTAPGWPLALLKLLGRASPVGIVPKGKDRGLGRFSASAVATCRLRG